MLDLREVRVMMRHKVMWIFWSLFFLLMAEKIEDNCNSPNAFAQSKRICQSHGCGCIQFTSNLCEVPNNMIKHRLDMNDTCFIKERFSIKRYFQDFEPSHMEKVDCQYISWNEYGQFIAMSLASNHNEAELNGFSFSLFIFIQD